MKYWTTKSGEEIKIKDMETSHIENCIRMLERNMPDHEEDLYEAGPDDWDSVVLTIPGNKKYKAKIQALKKELKNRGLV